MFGLPTATTWLVIGVPLFWVAYTLVFVWKTRDWPGLKRADDERKLP